MFCGNCGSENEKGAAFCRSCGCQLVTSSSSAVASDETQRKQKFIGLMEKIKNLPKKVLFGIGGGAVVLVVILCIILNGRNTINLNKYVSEATVGCNGYGVASVTVDWSGIVSDYGDHLKFTKAAEKDFGESLQYMQPIGMLLDTVSISIENGEYLSNGDKVKYVWNVDEEVLKYLNCKVKYKDGSFQAKNLQEVEKFDAFASLDVKFEGDAPYGRATCHCRGIEFDSNDFVCEPSAGLKNGDTITISINADAVDRCAEEYGKIPRELQKTFTVSGLEEYVTYYASLTQDFISLVRSETEDTIFSYTANSYSPATTLSDLAYEGYILAAKQNDEYEGSHNILYVIYSGNISNADGDFEPAKVYYPVAFTDIKMTEKEITYRDKEGIVGETRLSSIRDYTEGYTNPVQCCLEIIETQKENYAFECGDGMKKYSEYLVISKLDEISEAYRDEAKANAEYMINDYIASDYKNGLVASNLTYEGDYILKRKEDDQQIEYTNYYIVVFSATVNNTKRRFEPQTVYFPVMYECVVGMSDGTYLCLGDAWIEGKSYFSDNYYTTRGYVDGVEMYAALISDNSEEYSYEVSEGLERFGK